MESVVWYEDEHKQAQAAYRKYVEDQSKIQINVDYSLLVPMKMQYMGIENNKWKTEWVVVEEPSRATNDACEHYIHKDTKDRYTMCYSCGGCKWASSKL